MVINKNNINYYFRCVTIYTIIHRVKQYSSVNTEDMSCYRDFKLTILTGEKLKQIYIAADNARGGNI